MENKLNKKIYDELKIIKRLLAANLYASGVDSEDVGKITGINSTDIRKLISKRKMTGGQNAKKE